MQVDAGLAGALAAVFSPSRRGTVASVRTTPPLELRGGFHGDAGVTRFFLRNVTAGILDGDANEVTLCVKPGARVRVEPSSATRVFPAKCRGGSTRLSVEAHDGSAAVVSGGLTILHAGAAYSQTTDLVAEPGARLAYLDLVSLGRTASGEHPSFRSFHSELVIRERGAVEPLYEERYDLHLGSHAVEVHEAFGGCSVAGTAVLLGGGPVRPALPETTTEDLYFGSTSLPGDAGLLVRALGHRAELVAGVLEQFVATHMCSEGSD
ncbi:MAG: urease accessory protein UreD [Dehalococcoidia bacterium]